MLGCKGLNNVSWLIKSTGHMTVYFSSLLHERFQLGHHLKSKVLPYQHTWIVPFLGERLFKSERKENFQKR